MTHVRVLASGVTIAAAFVALRQLAPRDGSPLFFVILAVSAGAYLLAMRGLARGPGVSRRVLLCALVLALLWRLPLALAPVGRDADVHRYIWDARLQRAGLNPYAERPNDPAVAWLHTAGTRHMNNQGVASPYPPVAQFFFRGVTAVHESAEAFKVALVACEVLLVLVLWAWLVGRGMDPAWVLAYAWHPLATLEMARNGHFEVVGVLLLCLSALALHRGLPARAAVWFALAVGTKLLPVVLVPLYWGRLRPRHVLLAAAVLVGVSLPFAGGQALGSIPDVIDRFRFNAPLFSAGERVLGARGAAAAAVAVGLLAAVICRRANPARMSAAWAWPLAAALACAPLVYPWYLVWLLPFLTGTSMLPLRVWSLSIIAAYAVWHGFAAGAAWRVPPTVLAIEYVPPIAALLYGAWTARQGPAGSVGQS